MYEKIKFNLIFNNKHWFLYHKLKIMKNGKKIISHYLSISHKALINNKIIHSFFFIIEISMIFLQIIEINFNEFNASNKDNYTFFSPFTYLSFEINKLANTIKSPLYLIMIVIIIINYYILNFHILIVSTFIKIMINTSELFFYRILSLFIFNYCFIFKGIFLVINIIFTIIYVIILFMNFSNNHLFLFFPKITIYPYDNFSMIIDLHLLIIKIFISLSRMILIQSISKFFFLISISILLVLLCYISYLIIYKSYYLMNNYSLNKIRYSLLLSFSFVIIFILCIDRMQIFNIYFIICYINIIIICLLSILFFYDPYKFVRFDRDDNIENIFYYFFILDREKNSYLLLEEKIEEHLSKCNRCNLCKKYNNIKNKDNEEIDLYQIISDSNNPLFNLMNKILRSIKINGIKSISNKSYLLINLIYIYCFSINQNNYNSMLNTELLFEIINSENEIFLEQYSNSLSQIKYTNDFIIRAKRIIEIIYNIFDEKKLDKKIQIFFILGEELNQLKYRKIKSNMSYNFGNSNNNAGNIEGLPNCNNLLAVCTLFYEELYNDSLSSSGMVFRESPNLLEDLIINNSRNSKQITLEINVLNFEIKILRAGGVMNKYENSNFFDFLCPIFKKKQISEMKKILFQSNSKPNNELKRKSKTRKSIFKKGKNEDKLYYYFLFIIEEKEENEIFCKLLKMKLSHILLIHINNKLYLNGAYTLDNDIIITENIKNNEIVLYFGNKEQKDNIPKENKENDNKIIKKNNNDKFLGNNKLKKMFNYLGCKKYSVYRLLSSNKKKINELNNKNKEQLIDNLETEEDDNNKIFIYNDLASQTSSKSSSMSTKNLISYNRGNKKSHNNKNISKELNILKYILYLSFLIFFLFLIFETVYLKKLYNKMKMYNDFYIVFQEFCGTYYTLFFSVLTLGCIANSPESKNCTQYMAEVINIVTDKFFYKLIENNDMKEETLKSHFIDFTELIYYQNQILSENLNSIYKNIIYFLSKINNKKIEKLFNTKIIRFKINQDLIYDKLFLSLAIEEMSFSELNLLMISRFSMIINDINNFKQPIYILNKTGIEVFNNIYVKEKLSSYQENVYLLILDHKIYTYNLFLSTNDIVDSLMDTKNKIKNLVYFFISINLFFFIIIIIILLLYLLFYYIIIFKNLSQIHEDLKEKMEDVTIKQILRNKIDNLRLILNIYENDISKILENLNNIYNEYKENYKQKIKEVSQLMKKDGKFEEKKEKSKINFIKLIKSIKKLNLVEYSGNKNIFKYILILLILIYIILYIINILIWILFFQKDAKANEWNGISENLNGSVNNLLNNYLMMIYNNQTIEEQSFEMGVPDFISFIYDKITPIYELNKYIYYIKDLLKVTEMTMNYECSLFYENLDNELFLKLKEKFKGKEDKLIYTMWFFCEWSNIMKFNNYKTIYLQIFNRVKIGMENFNNYKYSDIIQFIDNNDVIQNEIMFLIIYTYMIDIMNDNVHSSIFLMNSKTLNNIIITISSFFVALIIMFVIIFIVYIWKINKDSKKFIRIRKVFKICKLNE